MAFAAKGDTLAALRGSDHIDLYLGTNGEAVAHLALDGGGIQGIEITADGKSVRVRGACEDGRLRTWRLYEKSE